ncbi:MAG TPA: hypothetical protein VJ600_02455 [Holophagaceae bacterium]|nr:hypothetical protein [Holophagaceae bacterium]
MIRRGLALLSLLALVACQPPSERIVAQHRYRFVMVFHDQFPGMGAEEREAIHRIYAEAVRARLVSVYGEPVTDPAPEGCPQIQVDVDALEIAGYPAKGGIFKDWLVDTMVAGALDTLTKNPDGEADQNARNNLMLDRFIERRVEKSRLDRLGYRPFLVEARLGYWDADRHYWTGFTGWELMPYMQPLKKLGDHDQAMDIRREEGRALAEKIISRLSARHDWSLQKAGGGTSTY